MKKNRLPKSEILRGENKFYDLFKNGKSITGEYIKVIYSAQEDFKIGFAISQKINGKVNINHLRRCLREIYRMNKHIFLEKMHVIIIQKKCHIKFIDLKADILNTVNDINYNKIGTQFS